MVKKQGDSLQQEEFPLPKYVQETLSKHNISLSPTSEWAGWKVRYLIL